MKRFAAAALIAVALLAPTSGWAYYLTCGRTVSLIVNGDEQQRGIAVGHSTGVVDVYAGLVCLVNGARCGCLSNLIVNRTDDFSEAIANELNRCNALSPSEPAFKAALRAANTVCGG